MGREKLGKVLPPLHRVVRRECVNQKGLKDPNSDRSLRVLYFYILYIFFRSYLILGREKDDAIGTSLPSGSLVVGQRSIVIEWKDEWTRRMRRFQRRARKCK